MNLELILIKIPIPNPKITEMKTEINEISNVTHNPSKRRIKFLPSNKTLIPHSYLERTLTLNRTPHIYKELKNEGIL